jgi:hypothetical protein
VRKCWYATAGASMLTIATPAGAVLAEHRRRSDGAGLVLRAEHHVVALETAVLAALSDARPCKHKTRRPPSAASMAEAAGCVGSARTTWLTELLSTWPTTPPSRPAWATSNRPQQTRTAATVIRHASTIRAVANHNP